MNPLVKKDILNVLRQAIDTIKEGRFYELRNISDYIIKTATVFQDKESIRVAVTVYSLSKVYKNEIDGFVLPHLEQAVQNLEEGNINGYENEIKHLINDIMQKDKKTNEYIQQVLERAQIKKASKMYEHGISMGQVADALGISLWEIMDYVGKTKIADSFDYASNAVEKLKFARELFDL